MTNNIFEEDLESKFFYILFNGDRFASQAEITKLINASLNNDETKESKMIEIMALIASSSER